MSKRLGVAIAAAGLLWVSMMVGPILAQVQVPFWHWPALYSAAENLAVKRGVGPGGETNGKLYMRIGWGHCLAVFEEEFDDLVQAAPLDRYINMRDYAEARLAEDTENIGWSDEDSYNCPDPPMVVKPTWRNSRPVYELVENAELSLWQKGPKTNWRVDANSPATAECTNYSARKDDGSTSNYYHLDPQTVVFQENETSTPNLLGIHMTAVCEVDDVSVEDYRW